MRILKEGGGTDTAGWLLEGRGGLGKLWGGGSISCGILDVGKKLASEKTALQEDPRSMSLREGRLGLL